MGGSVTGVTIPVASGLGRARETDFALIGHQESWRAAADVLAVLRGPKHTRLPDDEIKALTQLSQDEFQAKMKELLAKYPLPPMK